MVKRTTTETIEEFDEKGNIKRITTTVTAEDDDEARPYINPFYPGSFSPPYISREDTSVAPSSPFRTNITWNVKPPEDPAKEIWKLFNQWWIRV